MENGFKIRSLTKGQLASLYFPDIKKESASNQFRKWIVKSDSLKSKLTNADWKEGQKLLTPKQVGILVEFLGENHNWY